MIEFQTCLFSYTDLGTVKYVCKGYICTRMAILSACHVNFN